MQIFELAVSRYGHTAGEERNMPKVGKAHGKSAIRTENLNRWKGAEDANPEGYHVGQRCDSDRDGCFRHHVTHAFWDG